MPDGVTKTFISRRFVHGRRHNQEVDGQGFRVHQDFDGKRHLFFHSKALKGVQFDSLQEGQKVTYTEGRGPKGPCAENVELA